MTPSAPTRESVESPSPSSGHCPPLRWIPIACLIAGMGVLRYLPKVLPDISLPVIMLSMLGPAALGALIVLWWATFSRAPRSEKILGFLAFLTFAFAGIALLDPSLQGFGAMIYVIPTAAAALGFVLIVAASWSSRSRLPFALAAVALAFGSWNLLKSAGIDGAFQSDLRWRWERSSEDAYLAKLQAEKSSDTAAAPAGDALTKLVNIAWPGFRGPNRDGQHRGLSLIEDWKDDAAPREVWRRPIGPAWSSFAFADNKLFTQEQRGDAEATICLDAETGKQLWAHESQGRFWEAIAGAGPRATPTVTPDGVFALGGEGSLSRLNPASGQLVWQRDLREDAKRQPPMWGFSSSPLVHGGRVFVHAGGEKDKGLLAYEVESGEPVWSVPAGDHSYASPQLAELSGVTGILMLCNQSLQFVAPEDGKIHWKHDWTSSNYRALQPIVLGNAIIVQSGLDGTRRLEVNLENGEWRITEAWTTRDLKPDFNDAVEHQGFLYGFDGNILACVDAATGKRRWKKGRYGSGQVLLLPDSEQLLVISEQGELVLLHATPEKLDERARTKVLTGKTWNHPIVVGNRVYLRNAEEAACFEFKPFSDKAL